MHWYEAHATRDTNETWLLTVPALPELASYGASQTKAFANLRKGVQVAIAGRIEANQHVPSPNRGPANGVKAVEVPVLTVIKLALYSSMKAQNVSVPALAARLTTSEDRIQRLLRIEHNSQLDLLDQALQALGGSMHLDIDAPGFDCSPL